MNIIERLFGSYKKKFACTHINNGAIFSCSDKQELKKILNGKGHPKPTAQAAILTSLVEEGSATRTEDTFYIEAHELVQLDEYSRAILDLPERWQGSIHLDISGTTHSGQFSLKPKISDATTSPTALFNHNNLPFLERGDHRFLLRPADFMVFEALQRLEQSNNSEYDRLTCLYTLQQARQNGAQLDLGHFAHERMPITLPDDISIGVDVDNEGNLLLSPEIGDYDQGDLEARWHQLQGQMSSTIRIENEIVLFDKNKLEIVSEILSRRKVSAPYVKKFLEQPQAILSDVLAGIDLNFSPRVLGLGHFTVPEEFKGKAGDEPMDYFGTTGGNPLLPIEAIKEVITTLEELQAFREAAEEAWSSSKPEVSFTQRRYDIRDREKTENILADLEEQLLSQATSLPGDGSGDGQNTEEADAPDDTPAAPTVAKIDWEYRLARIEESFQEILYNEPLSFDSLALTPFPHQDEGIRWLLGMLLKEGIQGGLLADDMGLGKTFTTLSALSFYMQMEQFNAHRKPFLLVAPLSLIENWNQEIQAAFSTDIPFVDIIPQENRSLKSFLEEQPETVEINGEMVPIPSFKIGEGYQTGRLDLPRRLVMVTYQTLQKYQVAFSRIDWSVVVFDEAQMIKNPAALVTNGAKSLQADFKLLVTGTPVENSLRDIWCLMDTVQPGHLGTYTEFRRQYIHPVGTPGQEEQGMELREKIGFYMLRRTKEEELKGLPEITFHNGIPSDLQEGANSSRHDIYDEALSVDMDGLQRDMYEGVCEAVQNVSEYTALAGLHRLKDISLHPALADGGHLALTERGSKLKETFAQSGKLTILLEQLKKIKASNEKVIVFLINKKLQQFLACTLPSLLGLQNISVINGDTSTNATGGESRMGLIEKFSRHDGFNIIIMSPIAAGVGLNVVAANHVIHLERHWNPAREAQATDRAYRIGQTKDVHVYLPALLHPEIESFDANVHKLLHNKTLLKDAVVVPGTILPTLDFFADGDTALTKEIFNQLSWRQMEACALVLLEKELGGEGWLTKEQDHGADGVLQTSDGLTLIQCKQVARQLFKGYAPINEVTGAVPHYEAQMKRKVTQKLFVTNAQKLGKDTRKAAEDADVRCIIRDDIFDMLDRHLVTMAEMLQKLDGVRM